MASFGQIAPSDELHANVFPVDVALVYQSPERLKEREGISRVIELPGVGNSKLRDRRNHVRFRFDAIPFPPVKSVRYGDELARGEFRITSPQYFGVLLRHTNNEGCSLDDH